MNSIIRFDRYITFWFQSWPASLYPYMIVITQLGNVGWVIGVSLVIAITAYKKRQVQLALAFSTVLPGEGLNAILKTLFKRLRPQTQFAQDMLIHTKSFPSGHAFGSMLLYGLLAYLAFTRLSHGWNWFACSTLMLLIVLIGISRIYLGAHYFFDVLSGWILGAVILIVVIKVTRI